MKKAQMLRFLFWTIVGLAIFIPACALGSKLLAYSTQKDDPYKTLLSNIEKIAAVSGSATSETLYIDKGTAILIFPDGVKEIRLEGKEALVIKVTVTIEKPVNCKGGACVCGCTKFDGSWSTPIETSANMECVESECSNFLYQVSGMCKIENGEYGVESDTNFECKSGVYIGREVKAKLGGGFLTGSKKIVDTKSPERRSVRIENIGDSVYICENPDPSKGCMP